MQRIRSTKTTKTTVTQQQEGRRGTLGGTLRESRRAGERQHWGEGRYYAGAANAAVERGGGRGGGSLQRPAQLITCGAMLSTDGCGPASDSHEPSPLPLTQLPHFCCAAAVAELIIQTIRRYTPTPHMESAHRRDRPRWWPWDLQPLHRQPQEVAATNPVWALSRTLPSRQRSVPVPSVSPPTTDTG